MNAQRQLLFISQQHLEVPTEIRVLCTKYRKVKLNLYSAIQAGQQKKEEQGKQ